MIPVSLLCTDLDGTLLNHDGGLAPASAEALARARAAGLHVVPVTGRPWHTVPGWVRSADGPQLVGCSNGAVVRDARSGRVLHSSVFAAGHLAQVLAHLRAVAPGVRLGVELQQGGSRLEPHFVDLLPADWRAAWSHAATPDLAAAVGGTSVVKVVAVHPGLGAADLAEVCLAGAAHLMEATWSTDVFVEFSCPGADKGAALAWIAGHLGVHPSATAAVGDMPNDLPMLAVAALPAAVANAHPQVLAAARTVVPANTEHGVAALVDLLLGGAVPAGAGQGPVPAPAVVDLGRAVRTPAKVTPGLPPHRP